MNYEFICRNVISAASEAGLFIQSEAQRFSRDKIELKGLHNFVSYVDTGSEKILIEALRDILPDAGFIVEEGSEEFNGEELKWVIDPLDGTTNFIHGIPFYAISIALMEGDETVLGVVYELNSKECFYASKGKEGAFLDGKPIHVSTVPAISDSLVATGFPYNDFEKLPGYMNSLEYFLKNSHGARRIGSASVDLAYVACGRFEAFYEYSLQPWDVAAGAFILSQAGGKVTDFKGGNNYLFGKELIATNSFIHEEFLQIIQKHIFG